MPHEANRARHGIQEISVERDRFVARQSALSNEKENNHERTNSDNGSTVACCGVVK